jgi:hypothetical protein
MPDGYTLPLRPEGGAHYRELAAGLRELAGKCRLPNPRRELLDLARRYENRATELDRFSAASG